MTTLIKKSERRRPRALLCHCIVGPACKPVVRVTVAAGGRGALQATARALGYIHTGRLMQTNHFSLFHLFSFLLLALLAGLHDVARARRLRRHLRVAEHQKIGASLLRESPPEREERQRDAHFGLRGGGCKQAQLQSPARVAAARARGVRLVRSEGRGVSDQYGVRDAACPLSTRGGRREMVGGRRCSLGGAGMVARRRRGARGVQIGGEGAWGAWGLGGLGLRA